MTYEIFPDIILPNTAQFFSTLWFLCVLNKIIMRCPLVIFRGADGQIVLPLNRLAASP